MSGLSSGTKVTQHCYRSHMEYTVSDHKPVASIFTLQVHRASSPLFQLVEQSLFTLPYSWSHAAIAPHLTGAAWDE